MTDQTLIAEIISALTEKLFNHSSKISREVARAVLGLPVLNATPAEEAAMMQLRNVYVDDARMDDALDLDLDINRLSIVNNECNRATPFLSTLLRAHALRSFTLRRWPPHVRFAHHRV